MTEGDLLEATSEAADARLGAQVDRYSIVRLIGRGGMGTVYEARHTRLGRRVAIKFLLPRLAARPEILRRFENEAVAAGGLEHPNLVAVIDLGGAADGDPYLVMEYLEGHDCARLLGKVGPLPAPRAADIVLQACRGVAIAHASGIIHRDLKPENLFVTDAGDGGDLVKVLDFGIAKLRPLDGQVGTRTGATLGTTYYMSPEQARGAGEIDLRADVWSLGVVLYELLAGRKPFEGEDFLNIVHQILSVEPPPLGTLRPGLPAGLEAAVARAMRKEPSERFRSVAAFAEAIQPFAGRVAALRPVASPTAVTMESTARPTVGASPPARRRRAIGTILAIGAAAMAATFIIGRSPPGKARDTQRVSSTPAAAPVPPAPVEAHPSTAAAPAAEDPAQAPIEVPAAPRRRGTGAARPRLADRAREASPTAHARSGEPALVLEPNPY